MFFVKAIYYGSMNYHIVHGNAFIPSLSALATSKTWTRTLDPDPEEPGPRKNLDPEKPGPGKTWTLKSLDPEKHGINIGLRNMSDFRELCFLKTMRNVIYCLKVRVLADI